MSATRRDRRAAQRDAWVRHVPWDGPDPTPGDAIEGDTAGAVWQIESVLPLRPHDPNGARLVLRLSRTSTGELAHGTRIHPLSRFALSNPAGPPRVRQLAPEGPTALESSHWRDPDDSRPNASRRPKQVTGYRQFCPLRRMSSLPNSQVTEQHIRAADMLRAAADLASIGPSTPGELIVTHTAPGPRTGPTASAREQSTAGDEVRRVFRKLPVPLHALTRAVVLGNRSLQGWSTDEAARRGLAKPLDPKIELGRLLSVLDILAAHYALDLGRDVVTGATRLASAEAPH
jgi:hypothetical protein